MQNEPTPSKPSEPEQPASEGSSVQRLVGHLFADKTVYLYSVKLLRENREDQTRQDRFEEFYAAQDIRDVWAGIAMELEDEAVEVESVTRCVPILAFLSPNDQSPSAPRMTADFLRDEQRAQEAELGDRQYDEMIDNRMIEELEARDTGFSSDTPETDEFKRLWPDSKRHNWPCSFESDAFAKIETLERQRNDARARIKAMEESKTDSLK